MLRRFQYRIKKFLLMIRYKIILWFIGDMPVITNCVIYDDIMEYNFGGLHKPFICFNNRVKNLNKVLMNAVSKMETSDENVQHVGNSFVLKI